MKKTKIICISTAIVIALSTFSCTTLQKDVIISSIPKEDVKEIENFEYRITYLNASLYSDIAFSDSETSARLTACDQLISEIDRTLKNKGLIQAVQARLLALKGQLLLIEGKQQLALEALNASNARYQGDIQTLILSHRLGKTEDLSSANFQSSNKPLILLEQALDFYKAKDYLSSVAKFDESFIAVQSFYKDAYKSIRDNAWNLRALNDSNDDSSFIAVKELTIGQMMLMAQSTPKILDPYTAGNQYNESTLFRKLTASGLTTSALKDKAPAKTYSYSRLTKNMEARFLWNLYCNKKDKPGLRTKYSSSYKESGRASPIKDVPVTHEDFDAILGCVEYNLMQLTDGLNFSPDSSVSGMDFNKAIQKLSK